MLLSQKKKKTNTSLYIANMLKRYCAYRELLFNKANENVNIFRELYMKESHGEVKCNLVM